MNLYFELMKFPIFTMSDVCKYYENIESARSAVKRLCNQHLVIKIRNNMYTCISGETDAPVANRYQVACAISPTAYISHHTAMEYYGVANQVYYEIYVSSETPFNVFEFDGYTYRYVHSKCCVGIDSVKYSGGIRVTDPERTVVDSIKEIDRISGLEEVIANIQGIRHLQEKRILQYLACYNNQFLYQKTGYLLWHERMALGLSSDFFELCKEKIGKSKRYLTKDYQDVVYDNTWKMIVPVKIKHREDGDELINGGI